MTDPADLFAQYTAAQDRAGDDVKESLGILGLVDPNHPGGTLEDADRAMVDLMRGGKVVGRGVVEVNEAGYPIPETLRADVPDERPLRDLT